MQKTVLIFALIFSVVVLAQQGQKPHVTQVKAQSLPANVYNTLHDSTTQLDIVFITGKGGSMSLDGRNVRFFTSFVTKQVAEKKPNAPLDGTLLWQIDGKAFQMGNLYFTGDSSGYITFEKNNKEYINALTPDGSAFLKNRGGR